MYESVRQGLPRFFVVGVFAGILGVAACFEYPARLATGILLTGVGLALMGSGGVALWNDLRAMPPPAEGA
jgi:hypothetical protein